MILVLLDVYMNICCPMFHFNSPHLKLHLEIPVVFNPTQPAPISDETAWDEKKYTTSKGCIKLISKWKGSPSKV